MNHVSCVQVMVLPMVLLVWLLGCSAPFSGTWTEIMSSEGQPQ